MKISLSVSVDMTVKYHSSLPFLLHGQMTHPCADEGASAGRDLMSLSLWLNANYKKLRFATADPMFSYKENLLHNRSPEWACIAEILFLWAGHQEFLGSSDKGSNCELWLLLFGLEPSECCLGCHQISRANCAVDNKSMGCPSILQSLSAWKMF